MAADPQLVQPFCSYAHGDDDIVQAFVRAFQALDNVVNHNLKTFTDQAIGPGAAMG